VPFELSYSSDRNHGANFSPSDLFLWPLSSFLWWSLAEIAIDSFSSLSTRLPEFISFQTQIDTNSTLGGAILGLLAVLRFFRDIRIGQPCNSAYLRARRLILMMGPVNGFLFGMTARLGSFAESARAVNCVVCTVTGLLASAGMIVTIDRLGRRRWLLFGCLLGGWVVMIAVVAVIDWIRPTP
jgi:hypothetical protein